MRLQRPDVFDDLVDLRIIEGGAEGRHRAFLAALDAVADEVVVAFGVHQLGALAGGATAVGVTPAAGGCEQLWDIDLFCGGCRLLRSSRYDRNRERGSEYQR